MPSSSRAFDLDSFTPYLISVLASRVSSELAKAYSQRFGISVAEWRVIAHLTQTTKVSVREIFDRVDMDRVKVSRAAARLESAGLVKKVVNPADRRLVELSLTPSGHRLLRQIAPLALSYERELLKVLKPQDRAAFTEMVRSIIACPEILVHPDVTPKPSSTPPGRKS